jgi:hypothetical protein
MLEPIQSAAAAPGYKERSCLSKKRPLGAYRCRNCAGWHLTRQAL